MNRFLFACLALAMLHGGAAAEPRKLNVLHIVADDLNNDLGCCGHAVVKSPNIDKLAARGVRFDRAYCNYPVCNPSRTSFLSGKRPDTTGVVDNFTPTRTHLPNTVMLPQLFRQQGWRSEKVGKLYHTGDEFEDPASWDFDMRETREAKSPPKEQIVTVSKGGAIVLNAADADTWDGKVARKAVELLEAAARDGKPFYIAAGFRRPHTPYISPQKYFDLYAPEKMPPLTEPAAHLAGIPPIALTYPVGRPALPEAKRADVMCAYYASISFMDAQVGVLLEAMDRLKLWDTTVVVFQSDHGYHLGEHGGLWHKLTLFEECTRVPLIIAAPGKRAGVVSPRLVELVDLYPTLAELCGLTPPGDLEGLSAVPLLDDPQRAWKQAVFTVVARSKQGKNSENPHLDASYMGRSVRTDDWRYTIWPDGRAELYNLSRDPHEYANLANDAASAEMLAKMKQLLADGPQRGLPGK